MNTYRDKVIACVKKIPKGKVVSYGQVAAFCGSPRTARQVGGVLRALNITDGKVPWWRVVNNQGLISIKGNWTATKELQKELLVKDGVNVTKDFSLDINKYRWSMI